jgi:hypothetical protein
MKFKLSFLIFFFSLTFNIHAQQSLFRSNNTYIPKAPFTNGLVLHLEAGNLASYPGTGTIWTDLSPSANHGTILNGVTYNAANGGYFNFNALNQYITLDPSKLPTGTSDRTIIAFVRTPTSISGIQHVIHYGSTNTNQAFALSLSDGRLNTHTWAAYPSSGGAAVNPSTNYCFAVTYTNSGNLHNFWVNGVQQGSGVANAINTGTSIARIGMRILDGAEPWGPNGQIYQILIYNRALSNSEILEIYNTHRAKYGL